MNTKQVSEWLMEAAGCIRESGEDYSQFLKWHNTRDELAKIADKMADRAAQIEAMTCDGCKHWLVTIHPEFGCGVQPMGSECKKVNIKGAGEKFGCIHWEEKA